MVRLALYFKAELENVTDVEPGDEDYEWHFQVKCTSCSEVNENWVGVNKLAQNEISGSRGIANFVMRCKFCKRESSAQIDRTSIKPYTIDNNGQFTQIAIIECRGLEFVDFDPRIGFKAKGVDSGTIFENIDLTEGDWAEYDEEWLTSDGSCFHLSNCSMKAQVPVGISNIKSEFKRA
ncbi:4139_t:CDS:2 [Acaulospora morrowiae]|uniref:4139_t:CDS:1 n=1 Tax=Acaulospora morrowiae TaxID=94023 RepID=A0A9N9A4A4_9GLOM|nr:4139_t:CDS:2 [Acaulospora morrowiae]